MSMPSGVQYGRVTGRLIRAVLDGSDGDESPDGAPIPGATVTFRARVTHAKNASAEPPVTIFLDPVVAATDENGVLVTRSGQPGVWLVATDDPGMDPVIGSYTVTVAAPTITSLTWGIVVPSGGTVDLATAVPVPSAPAAALAEWVAVRGEVLAARDVAVAVADGIPDLVAAEVGSAVLPHAQSAQASATAAAVSATAADGSVINAATSATAAAGSATAAAESATNAVAAADEIPGLVADYLTANPPPAGDDGREVELQTSATHVQWRYIGDVAWLDLVPLELITGQDGSHGLSAELRTNTTHIQWRQAGGAWADLIPLASLVGPAGPPNTLTIGTVTTGAAGTAASAAVTGTAPNQTLSLTIPRGTDGSPTAYELRGSGQPNGVVTAPTGTYYTDTARTAGAWRWYKASGSGNTGWIVEAGDTGDVNIASLLDPNFTTSGFPGALATVARFGNSVTLSLMIYVAAGAAIIGTGRILTRTILNLPAGLGGPGASISLGPAAINSFYDSARIARSFPRAIVIAASAGTWAAGDRIQFTGNIRDAGPWPTTLTV